MTNRILLIQAPENLFKKQGSKDKEYLGLSYPPLGLAYIAAVTKKNGWQTKILDPLPQHLSLADIYGQIEEFDPQVVGYTAVTSTFACVAALAKRIKKKYPKIITIIGGPHASAAPEKTMLDGSFDFAVLGEGEETIKELLPFLARKRRAGLGRIKGIGFRNDNQVVFTPPRAFVKDLDALPFPARELLPSLSAYQPNAGTVKNLPAGSIITSRGCPFRCTFCDRGIFGNLYRVRSSENIVSEMELLVKKYGAKEIRIWDDTFNTNMERVKNICRLIIRKKLKFTWSCLARVNFTDTEMLALMKKAGCWQISYGIESGNEEMIKSIAKGLTKNMVGEAVKRTHQAGIETKGFFILGMPGETKASLRETIDFAKELDLDIATFSIATPLPGTELYEQVKNTPQYHETDFSNQHPYFPTSASYAPTGLSKKDLLEFQRRAHREFYLRPHYVLKELRKVRSLADLKDKAAALARLISR